MFGFIGFWGSFDKAKICTENYGIDSGHINNEMYEFENFFIKRITIKKFLDDKIFYSSSKLNVTIEGVIYNLSEIKKDLHVKTNAEAVIELYKKYGDDFVKKLNGNFAISIFDCDKLMLYTNHTSYKSLYYYNCDKGCIFSTDINWLLLTLGEMGETISTDVASAVCLLNHGYMLGENTLVENVKKILPGHYIRFANLKIEDVTWLSFDDIKESNLSYEELLEYAEEKFKMAVKRVYEKDLEYGYKHLLTLSGGLDSRSVAFVANELGYQQTFATMGESGCLDVEVATAISKRLNGTHIILHLDNGNYLCDIEDAVKGNGGTITYPGYAHISALLKSLNLARYGQIHTGEVGDVLFGGGKEKLKNITTSFDIGAFSYIYNLDDCLTESERSYIDREIKRYKNAYWFFLYNRCLNSAQNGWYASYLFTESSSPFLDVDFMKFILSVPSRYLRESKFYVDWMKKYHPSMCEYKWTTTRTKPDASKILKLTKKFEMVFRERFLRQNLSMNPYKIWWGDNDKLKKAILSEVIEKDYKLISKNVVLRKICDKILSSNNVTNIFMLATLLKSIELYKLKL